MSEKVHDLFSSIAPRYDLLNTVLSLGVDRRWRQKGSSYLQSPEYRQVLDLCAGTLALTKELLKRNPLSRVTALDFSQEMLDRGLATLPKNSRLKTVCADFLKWSGDSASFDGVMVAYGLRNIDDNRAAVRKVYDLLRPGGRFVILEFFQPDRWYTWAFHKSYAEFVIPTIGRLVSRHREAYRHLRDSVRGFSTLDAYVSLLKETGFEIKTARRLTGGVSGLIVADKR